jgi:hypothetical protein
VVGAYSFAWHREYVKMHTIPASLQAFDVNGPIPTCGRWKDTMPKTRDPAAYRLYIKSRKLWRSKIEWQLTRQEALGILLDVQAAANQGDWGARALMAYFYRHGLGPLDTNHVLDLDADKLDLSGTGPQPRLDIHSPRPRVAHAPCRTTRMERRPGCDRTRAGWPTELMTRHPLSPPSSRCPSRPERATAAA